MKWMVLTFGKHAGRTLPEIVIKDADWFFWAIENQVFKGGLEFQAADLYRKTQAIRIPKRRPSRWQVEYHHDVDGRFLGLRLVKAEVEYYQTHLIYRLPHLDLTRVRRGCAYDKKGCRNLLRDLRYYFFGPNRRITRRRIEAFFSDESKFINDHRSAAKCQLARKV